MMPRCPYCRSQIDKLLVGTLKKQRVYYEVSRESNEICIPEWHKILSANISDKIIEIRCPICRRLLPLRSEEDIEVFLCYPKSAEFQFGTDKIE